MNLYHLRYFVLLARTGHFKKTAEKLCIAQPSLSHAISQLEKELGVVLFEKQGRQSVLTQEGKQFLVYVERSLDLLDDGVSLMKDISMGEGMIKIGFLRTLGSHMIPELVKRFLESMMGRGVHFQFHTGMTGPLLQDLKEEHYDIVFCTMLESEKEIEFFSIARQDLVLIVPKDHPLACNSSVSLEDTAEYSQVYFSHASGLRSIVDQLYEKIQVHPRIAYEVDEDIVVAGLVAKGFGIAVVPFMEELSRMDVEVLSISYPSCERKIYMAVLKNRHQTPAVKKFIDYVQSQYDQTG